ncbi:HAMP domain-containing sensor histidine kinase [Paenibacillus sp. JCM 10914]|uniref:sensor histidine kinase n=1 Tax=Paenibacillus sp. JCM 10914 TaxID=1236974 RepID=UPI0003CCB6E6|nr:HAMP domain-containing sensor histidine kinase [Paenibacillus sp. JCM 10914]GAE06660.1 two-component sensor histidine kinase [Paenibacillus sp. JCM 10914]
MRLRRRLAFHFTYQLIAFSAFMFCFLIVLLFFLIKHIGDDEMRRNFPMGVLNNIVSETVTENGEVLLSEGWKVLLKERAIWLQVVDMEGNVIHATNTVADVPSEYSVSSLLEIKEERRLGKYTMDWQMDLTYEDPLLYLMGRIDEGADRLRGWVADFQVNGVVGEGQEAALIDELALLGGYLHVIDEQGTVIQSIGRANEEKAAYHPLEIIAMQEQPGTYATNIAVYRDSVSANTWIYHTPQEGSVDKRPMMEEMIWVAVWTMVCVLLLSLTVAIWHGYRYSRPLLLFTGWFERMGSGSYEEVLTPKDRKRVFRKNGKLRTRFKLYKEVIQSFYDMAERLAEIERERKRLDRNREEWMSGISHDLRTPLSSIQGYGYMLESAPQDWDPVELREMGTVIREKGDYMLELINDFSLVFHLKSEIRPQELSRLDLNELVRRCVLKYVNDATRKAAFTYIGSEAPVFVNGNAKWLQRLMDNLISNAVKHNPEGVKVEVRVERRPSGAAIMVADQGVGMDEETRINLFERYYRGTNTEESMEGSGLGMSIAKAIVEAHKGSVSVWSEMGRGTTLTVLLPEADKPPIVQDTCRSE